MKRMNDEQREDALDRAMIAAGVAEGDRPAVKTAFADARKRGLGDEEALRDAFDDAGVPVADPAAGVTRFSERKRRYEERGGANWRRRIVIFAIAVVALLVFIVAVNLGGNGGGGGSLEPTATTGVVEQYVPGELEVVGTPDLSS